jgi:hypothetical protein
VKECGGTWFSVVGLKNELEISMQKGTKIALACGAVPFVTLVLALPFVNRAEPFVLGLPFVLFWILAWVAATPVALGIGYYCERRFNAPGEDE